MKTHSPNNTPRITAIVLLIVVALNALAAGYSFITDPSGNGLGMTTSYLKSSAPFKDFFIPGVVLFIVNGVISLLVAGLAIFKQKNYATFILLQGGILVGWIGLQLMMVTSFHSLHFIIGLVGLTLIFLGWRINQKQVSHVQMQ